MLNNTAEKTPETSVPAKSSLISRNITIAGRRTSVRLEPEMWTALFDICKRERSSVHDVCTAVAEKRHAESSLTAAIRVFIMAYFRAASTDDGHLRAGHGHGAPFTITPTMVGTENKPAKHNWRG